MRESLEQTPRRIHTGKGGKRTEMTTRRMSDKHSQHMGGGLAGGDHEFSFWLRGSF